MSNLRASREGETGRKLVIDESGGMLQVVRGRDRGSWGILARRFLHGRVDPYRFGHRGRFGRSVDEALWMTAKGLGQDLAPMVEQARSVTVVNDRWRHESDRTVVVFGVVPVEQLRKRLEQAEIIIEVKKEISALLAIPLKSPDNDERS